MSSLVDHLNGKTISRKMGLRSVLTKQEDTIMITWTLTMQECELSIILQQLKMKVAKLTHTRATPFRNGIPGTNWWYWFKCRHPKISIW